MSSGSLAVRHRFGGRKGEVISAPVTIIPLLAAYNSGLCNGIDLPAFDALDHPKNKFNHLKTLLQTVEIRTFFFLRTIVTGCESVPGTFRRAVSID